MMGFNLFIGVCIDFLTPAQPLQHLLCNCRQPAKPCAWEAHPQNRCQSGSLLLLWCFMMKKIKFLWNYCVFFENHEIHTIAWIFIEIAMIFIDLGLVWTPNPAIFIRKSMKIIGILMKFVNFMIFKKKRNSSTRILFLSS